MKQITELVVSINPDTKMSYSGLLMWVGLSKIQYFIDFMASFLLEAVEDRDVIFNQIQGSKVKIPHLVILQIPFFLLKSAFLMA